MPATLAAVILAAAAQAPAFVDPLDVPAAPSGLAVRSPLSAVAVAGARLVAVGQRGHVLWSKDAGATWTQARVPVSTDLTAVCFASPVLGWAAGHAGVVLRTLDGGRSWERQLDDRDAGSDGSLLDIWFADERRGFAVGAFDLILGTEDGGATWTSWRDRTENPRRLHLYSIASGDGAVWIGGEQGLLLRLDERRGRFRAVRVPYGGTFFGVGACREAVLAWGLRGNVVRTVDGGVSWQQVKAGLDATLTGATVATDGRLVLVSLAGQLAVSDDCGTTFRTVAAGGRAGASAIAPAGPDAIVVVGAEGARVEPLR